ncbi:hypothetical protein Ciccas_002269 [Cichlidogyrus casuarinus]|uniref:Uncharacterized protein n=1 Tax=Cichlidogyrus casuarinus TaxID=1844966 RepID=A0ABD2QIQ1_9PLAT
MSKTKLIQKTVEDVRANRQDSIIIVKKELAIIPDIGMLSALSNLRVLTLSHNKIAEIPSDIVELSSLERLNLCGNHITLIAPEIAQMERLRQLNLSFNKIETLPRGFGGFPCLELLDLSYNFLTDASLQDSFYELTSLRYLYLSDNFFEYLSSNIRKLRNLEILALRDNDLCYLPNELGELRNLKELHLQNNRLSYLPPSLADINFTHQNRILKLAGNKWNPKIESELNIGISHVLNLLKNESYRNMYSNFIHKLKNNCFDEVPPKAKKTRKRNL